LTARVYTERRCHVGLNRPAICDPHSGPTEGGIVATAYGNAGSNRDFDGRCRRGAGQAAVVQNNRSIASDGLRCIESYRMAGNIKNARCTNRDPTDDIGPRGCIKRPVDGHAAERSGVARTDPIGAHDRACSDGRICENTAVESDSRSTCR
jgi:hypothetical protein